MKRILYSILAAAVLIGGLAGCKGKEEAVTAVDLRYRAENSYDLPATSAQPFTIQVVSDKPWTVRSAHPTWCIISDESGEASDAGLVFLGKATPTVITVQYYDNTELDDREDVIEIKSDYWVGKLIKVSQKGIAYLEIPEEDLNIDIAKAGGDYSFHVLSNQNWTAKIKNASEVESWFEITDGEEGTLDGTVSVHAETNIAEQRYAYVEVYDRHDVKMATVKFTQDGLQLEPETMEMRAEWNQAVYELPVASNVSWTAAKHEEHTSDGWFEIENPSNTGNANLRITLQPNETGAIRESIIVLENVTSSGEEFRVRKEIKLRQAYKVVPVRHICDEAEVGSWGVTSSTSWTGTPSYNGTGMLVPAPTQIKKSSMEPGLYTFHWSGITAGSKMRLWYVISGQEIKYNFKNGTTDISGNSSFGSLPNVQNASYDASVTTHEPGIGLSPLADGYCHVWFLFDNTEFYSCDTGASLGSNYKWGTGVDIYLGVEGTAGTDSAVLEWYEYTAPFSWD